MGQATVLPLGLFLDISLYLKQIPASWQVRSASSVGQAATVVQGEIYRQSASVWLAGQPLAGHSWVPWPVSQQLQSALDQTLADQLLPAGVTVALLSPTQGTWLGASGFANLATHSAMLPTDRVQVASLTKVFVATVVLQLVEEGKLRLSDRLDRWLPAAWLDVLPHSRQITIQQLLNHTSGIHDYTDADTPFGRDLQHNSFRPWRPQDLIAALRGLPPYFAPGAAGQWRYSNTNYLLLGQIVEAASGQTLAQAIRRRILTPLALKDTFLGGAEAIPGGWARGYWAAGRPGDPQDLSNIDFSAYGAAGALVSNAADLARFAEALFGGELLRPDSLRAMTTFVNTGEGGGYGLGLMRLETPWGTAWGHTGDLLGYEALMLYWPHRGITAVALSNQRVQLLSPTLDTLDASLRVLLGNPAS